MRNILLVILAIILVSSYGLKIREKLDTEVESMHLATLFVWFYLVFINKICILLIAYKLFLIKVIIYKLCLLICINIFRKVIVNFMLLKISTLFTIFESQKMKNSFVYKYFYKYDIHFV